MTRLERVMNWLKWIIK